MAEHLIIIGGGAAGFFCAVNAASLNPSLRVTILEKSGKVLSKVRVSGGGRCNVTHACFRISDMVHNYPRGSQFLKKAFHNFFTNDTVQWFKERMVQLKTESDGRMFPVTDSSDTIIDCLLREAEKYHIKILLNSDVQYVEKQNLQSTRQFRIILRDGKELTSDFLCIACGGFPRSAQYEWIKSLGHQIVLPVPSLFTFNVPVNNLKFLMGVSVPNVRVKIKGTSFQMLGPLLITHWGFSGPVVLKLSAFSARQLSAMNYDFHITINWLGDTNENVVLDKLRSVRIEFGKRNIGNKNPFGLPARLWEYHLGMATIPLGIRWAELPAKQQNLLARNLSSQNFNVTGKTTFKEEFVTAGGVLLSEISPASMESRIVPDLYFAGEIMDVDGITGGFNFQHAWTTGYIAAKSIAGKKFPKQ